jgi:flagellar motor switch/type III secretory pathway protein FliN
VSALAPAAFPWSRVPRVERESIGARRELFARVSGALDCTRIAAAASQVLGADVEVAPPYLLERRRAEVRQPAALESVTLQFSEQGLCVSLLPEADLVRACVARLLGQEFELGWADTGIDAALRGAGAALVLEVARRAAKQQAPELCAVGTASSPWLLHGKLTLRVAGKPYRLEVWVEALAASPREPTSATVGLARLGELPLAVPWVCAVSSITLAALGQLALGDVWLPGRAAWLASASRASDELPAAGLLAAPRSIWGLPVRASGGRIVLGAEAVLLQEDLESSMDQEESQLEQIVGEVPVSVRLEIGVLEMSAAEWAALRPGDVVQSGRRLEDAVILRAAGREIARGELVDIDGEIGVRLTRVGSSTSQP